MHIILEVLEAGGESVHLGIHRSIEVSDDTLDEVELCSLSVHLVLDVGVEQVESGLHIGQTVGDSLGKEFLLSDHIVTEEFESTLESGNAVVDSGSESLYLLGEGSVVVIKSFLESVHLLTKSQSLAVESIDYTLEVTGVLHLDGVVDFRSLVNAGSEKRRRDYA